MALKRPPTRHERLAHAQGYLRIAGVDEAGRGPLAGPVVASAIILPSPCRISGIADSKLLTPEQRAAIFEKLICLPHAIGIVDSETIDRINILQASLQAMRIAIVELSPDYLLVDGINHPDPTTPGQTLIKGEHHSLSIAAASILAKVTRDRLMVEAHERWPEYGFAQHKGYGTLAHRRVLKELGPCPIHRTSFRGVCSV